MAAITPLRITTWNLENFSAHEVGRVEHLAQIVADELHAPHIIAVQELAGDYRGEGKSHGLNATENANSIIAALQKTTGREYAYCESPMKRENQDGAKKGWNIRNGFFYRTDRVTLNKELDAPATVMDRNPKRFAEGEEPFKHTRKPIIGQFLDLATNELFTITNIHLTARITMERFLKKHPELSNAPEKDQEARLRQENEKRTQHRNDQVDMVANANTEIMRHIRGADDKHAIVCGDFNTAEQSTLQKMTDIGMISITEAIPDEQYSRNSPSRGREGIDHIYATPKLAERVKEINRYMQPENKMLSDHNPTTMAVSAPHKAIEASTGPHR